MSTAIAITGLALRLPGANTPEEFWRLLRSGTDQTSPVSEQRRALAKAPDWDDVIGEVDGIDLFDADFFGVSPDEARFMDPQHRIGMEVAHEAVADAGLLEPEVRASRRYSVHMALSTNAYYPLVCQWMDEHGTAEVHPRTIMNSINSALAARVSHQYNLTGPVMAVDTACSSFLTALVAGIEAIKHQSCDGAVVGGVNLLSSRYSTLLANVGGITTSHPFTRVFDEQADGTLIGEGAVVVVLEREDIARQRNRRILGRVLAHAINNDGSSLNIMAPNPRGQADVIRDCYAGIDHSRIGYVETHGTGTRIGDPVELNALGQVYQKSDFGERKVGIGSVKTNIGHLLSAAGGAGLAKLLLSLEHGELFPNLNFETANPLLELETTPFEVVTATRDWPSLDGQPRVGAITSLGLGGTNVHVVVEAGPSPEPGPRLESAPLCLSARSPEALQGMLAALREHLETAEFDPYNLSMTLARFRPAHPYRAVARLDADGHLSGLRFSEPTGVKRVLLRPTAENLAREEFLRSVLACKVTVGEAEPRRGELVLDASQWSDLADLDVACELYLAGCAVVWERLFPNHTGTVCPLPSYPFARQSHWLQF